MHRKNESLINKLWLLAHGKSPRENIEKKKTP